MCGSVPSWATRESKLKQNKTKSKGQLQISKSRNPGPIDPVASSAPGFCNVPHET